MGSILIYGMVYLGSALMVYNIYGFICFARLIQTQKHWTKAARILYLPIVLLVCFLLGYLGVGIFGKPDLLVSGILFGGSIFVFVIYHVLNRLLKQLFEEEQVQAKLIAAEESNRVKRSFLASLSHEMRTPMNVILGLNNMALRDAELRPETRELLERIRLSAKLLLGLINNILDINRIDSGELTLKSEKFSMPETVAELNAIVNTLCMEKGLVYTPGIWDCPEVSFMGDGLLIRRVLLSVLDNAVKYTDPSGSVSFTIQTKQMEEDRIEARFKISDTGVGIAREFLPKIFDVFNQEDSSSTSKFGGGGASLSVSNRIVKLMGGRIEVESEKNKGSTFTIILPMTPLREETAAMIKLPPDSLSGLRILIVEDVEDNADILADLLELENAESEHAENGQIAVEMVRKSSPFYYSAVLMDLRMPIMDGLAAAREIRQLDRPDTGTMPIIALTANTSASDVEQTREAGMNEHLGKPIDPDLLYDTLRKACSGQAQSDDRI